MCCLTSGCLVVCARAGPALRGVMAAESTNPFDSFGGIPAPPEGAFTVAPEPPPRASSASAHPDTDALSSMFASTALGYGDSTSPAATVDEPAHPPASAEPFATPLLTAPAVSATPPMMQMYMMQPGVGMVPVGMQPGPGMVSSVCDCVARSPCHSCSPVSLCSSRLCQCCCPCHAFVPIHPCLV